MHRSLLESTLGWRIYCVPFVNVCVCVRVGECVSTWNCQRSDEQVYTKVFVIVHFVNVNENYNALDVVGANEADVNISAIILCSDKSNNNNKPDSESINNECWTKISPIKSNKTTTTKKSRQTQIDRNFFVDSEKSVVVSVGGQWLLAVFGVVYQFMTNPDWNIFFQWSWAQKKKRVYYVHHQSKIYFNWII